MIKPPFTLLILKKTQQPVTVRITTGFIVLVLVFLILLWVLAGLGFSIAFLKCNFPFLDSLVSIKPDSQSSSYQISITPESDEVSTAGISSLPGIKNLSIIQHNKDMEIVCSFSNMNVYDTAYLWLVLNPDADTAGEIVIYPRSPIFRGFPVDFRNGIECSLSDETDISIPLSNLMNGINFKNFRIILYSSEGNILFDKRFTVDQPIRM